MVRADDGGRRPWHCVYVRNIESRLTMRVRYDKPKEQVVGPAGRDVVGGTPIGVLQMSIPAQIRQVNLYVSNNEGLDRRRGRRSPPCG